MKVIEIIIKTGAIICALVLAGCSVSVDGESYKNVSPTFDINRFFNGNVKAWGIVQNRSGDVVQRFVVDIEGTQQGDVLILDETFHYDIGEGPLTRTWEITQQSDGRFSGRAQDIEGIATGMSYGNAFNFQYSMILPVGDSEYAVTFDDWFWAFDDTTMMNRSYIRKFGIVMAEVTIFMQRQP